MAASPERVRVQRPFWMHQVVEYILGIVLVAQGLQSPTPLAPALAGGVVLVNTAIARGPMAAFRLVGRAQHRIADLVVMAVIVVLAVQPVIEVEAAARLVMVAIAGVMFFVWRQSSFAERPRGRAPIDTEGGRSTEIGRLAGRAVGDGIAAARKLKRR